MSTYVQSGLTGAGAGAAAGAAVGGPWGAFAGGALGLATGLFSAYEAAESEREKRKILEKAARELNTSTDQLLEKVNEWYATNPSIGTKEDIEQYRQLATDYDPNEFVYDYKDFEDTYDVNDYYAPNKEALIEKTADKLQAMAAGAGIGRGTGAANQIATGVAEKNEELYKDALEAMNQDRQFAYNLWNAKIQQGQNRLNQLKSAKDTQLSLYGGLAEDFQNWNKAKLQDQLDLEQNKMNNQLSLTLASI